MWDLFHTYKSLCKLWVLGCSLCCNWRDMAKAVVSMACASAKGCAMSTQASNCLYARSYISPYKLAVFPATKSDVMAPRAWKYVPSMAGSALSQYVLQ